MTKSQFSKRWPRAAYIVLHAVSGVYAGGCLCVAAVDMAVLGSLSDSARGMELCRLLLPAMGRLMVPQLGVMLLLMLALTWRARGRAPFSWLPLALLAVVLTITLAVHIPINQRILTGRLELPELRPLLDRWATFHALRTILALALPYAIVRFLRRASAPAVATA